MYTVSFPGLGIGEFTLNPVAFTLPLFGGVEVHWYGILMLIGVVLAVLYCFYRAKQEALRTDDLLDMAIWGILAGVVGARVFYVLGALDEFKSFYDIIAIWEGGLAIFGAMLFGGLAIFAVCRHKKLCTVKALDVIAPSLMIAQILGRIGDFFECAACGVEMTEDSLLYFTRMSLIPEGAFRPDEYYPVFFYELLWNLLGFVLLNLLYRKKKFDGQIFLIYLSWYGFGRMLLEELRSDALTVGVFKLSQVAGFICFTVGLCLLIYRLVKARRAALTAEEYTPTYAKFHYGEASAAVREKWQKEENTEKNEDTPQRPIREVPDGTEAQEETLAEETPKEDLELRSSHMTQDLKRLFEDDDTTK